MRRSVVVTGVGLVTPLGSGCRATWDSLCAGRSAIRAVTEFEDLAAGSVTGATVRDFVASEHIRDDRSTRDMTRPVALGVAAAAQAASDSALDFSGVAERVGTFVGAPGRSYDPDYFREAVSLASDTHGLHLGRFAAAGMDCVSPLWLLSALGNNVLYFVSLEHHLLGMNGNFPCGDVAGTLAIGEAFHAIQRGYIDVAFAGGYDSLFETDRIEAYRAAQLMTQMRAPASLAHRPFDRHRDGFAASEGAAFLILEEAAHARQRGARIHGEVVGYGTAAVPLSRMSLGPSARGFATALQTALADADVDAIDAVFAYGLGTRSSDLEEAVGLNEVLRRCRPRARVTAPKCMVGNTGAASGAIETVVALMAVRDGFLPPIVSRLNPDPECDLDFVAADRGHTAALGTVAVCSANAGGNHATLVLRAGRPS